jgi:hypothetical protein
MPGSAFGYAWRMAFCIKNKNIMIRFCTALILLVGLRQVLPAQTLLPYLGKNGKYGFADETGKIIIAPEFEGRMEPFFEKTLAIDCQKNGETVRLFRSGLVVPNPRLKMSRLLPVLNFDENDVRMDSIGHLIAVRVEQKMQLIHLQAGGKMVESYQPDYLNLPRWAKLRESSDGSGLEFRLHHGLARIFRADGRVNFVDENLREILPKDVAAGVVADAQHLIFAESEGRFGIANRSGKTVVTPVFRSLEPSGRARFFLANKQRNGSIGEKWSCGLIRADGKIVLDTVYSDIEKVEGADLLIVRNMGAKSCLLRQNPATNKASGFPYSDGPTAAAQTFLTNAANGFWKKTQPRSRPLSSPINCFSKSKQAAGHLFWILR